MVDAPMVGTAIKPASLIFCPTELTLCPAVLTICPAALMRLTTAIICVPTLLMPWTASPAPAMVRTKVTRVVPRDTTVVITCSRCSSNASGDSWLSGWHMLDSRLRSVMATIPSSNTNASTCIQKRDLHAHTAGLRGDIPNQISSKILKLETEVRMASRRSVTDSDTWW